MHTHTLHALMMARTTTGADVVPSSSGTEFVGLSTCSSITDRTVVTISRLCLRLIHVSLFVPSPVPLPFSSTSRPLTHRITNAGVHQRDGRWSSCHLVRSALVPTIHNTHSLTRRLQCGVSRSAVAAVGSLREDNRRFAPAYRRLPA
jgi:hypothetical protein